MTEAAPKGWGYLINSRKWHYFNGSSESLCGRWLHLGRLADMGLNDSGHESSDNCAECRRRRAKLEAKEQADD